MGAPLNAAATVSLLVLALSTALGASAQSLTVPTSLPSWAYQGCYADVPPSGQSFALNGFFFDGNTNSQSQCVTICGQYGWGYAGVEAGSSCTCGNFLPSSAKLTSSANCNVPCTGDSTRRSACGGAASMNLFKNQAILDRVAASSRASSVAAATTARTSSSLAASSASKAAATTPAVVKSSTTSTVSKPVASVPAGPASRSTTTAAVLSSSSVSPSASAGAVVAGATNTAATSGSTGALAGGIAGGVLALILLASGAFFLIRRRQRRSRDEALRTSHMLGGDGGGTSSGGRGGDKAGGAYVRGMSVSDEGHGPLPGSGMLGVGAATAGGLGAGRAASMLSSAPSGPGMAGVGLRHQQHDEEKQPYYATSPYSEKYYSQHQAQPEEATSDPFAEPSYAHPQHDRQNTDQSFSMLPLTPYAYTYDASPPPPPTASSPYAAAAPPSPPGHGPAPGGQSMAMGRSASLSRRKPVPQLDDAALSALGAPTSPSPAYQHGQDDDDDDDVGLAYLQDDDDDEQDEQARPDSTRRRSSAGPPTLPEMSFASPPQQHHHQMGGHAL